jgi:hypothetical protein
MSHPPPFLLLLPFLLAAGACDQIAVLDGTKAREADALAVGSACRQSGRALEDCFMMYPDSPKAQVFAGWKDMNDYMTSNKIEVVLPALVKAEAKGDSRTEKSAGGPGARPAGSDKVEVRPTALPPTSAAAANPLAGLPKSPAGDKSDADKAVSKQAPAAAKN